MRFCVSLMCENYDCDFNVHANSQLTTHQPAVIHQSMKKKATIVSNNIKSHLSHSCAPTKINHNQSHSVAPFSFPTYAPAHPAEMPVKCILIPAHLQNFRPKMKDPVNSLEFILKLKIDRSYGSKWRLANTKLIGPLKTSFTSISYHFN